MDYMRENNGKIPCAPLYQGNELDLPSMHPWYEKETAIRWQTTLEEMPRILCHQLWT